jgi:carbonic anhydrase
MQVITRIAKKVIPAIATVSLIVAALAVTTTNIYNVIPLAYSQQNDGATNATTTATSPTTFSNTTTTTSSPIEQFKIEEHRFNDTTSASTITPAINITNNTITIQWPNIHSSVLTDFDPNVYVPKIEESAFIHPFAVVIGDCNIGKLVLVAPTAVCRGDEGTPIKVGDFSNIQDGVVLHALETNSYGRNVDERRFSVDGDILSADDPRFKDGYAVFVGNRVSLAHDSLVHGPAWIGNNTFVGFKSMVFNAKVGNNVSIGVSSTITGGVTIPDNKYVPPGSVIVTQAQADQLQPRVGSPLEKINDAVIQVNEELAEGYNQKDLEKLARDRESEMEKGVLETSMPDGRVK